MWQQPPNHDGIPLVVQLNNPLRIPYTEGHGHIGVLSVEDGLFHFSDHLYGARSVYRVLDRCVATGRSKTYQIVAAVFGGSPQEVHSNSLRVAERCVGGIDEDHTHEGMSPEDRSLVRMCLAGSLTRLATGGWSLPPAVWIQAAGLLDKREVLG